jgi:hypothetical protein
MPIYDLYSRRRQRELGQEPDIYVYGAVPEILRGQVVHIWNDAIGAYDPDDRGFNNNHAWRHLRSMICRERGLDSLRHEYSPKKDCIAYIRDEQNAELWLDLVEITFRYVDRLVSEFDSYEREKLSISIPADEAIDELNERFRHASFGYRFDNGQIFRIDSELVHAEIVKPALLLLSDKRFKGPQAEYLVSHEHYREGHTSDAITNANKAFESTMKVICDLKGWQFDKGARASDLVKVVRGNGLLPGFTEKAFDSLVNTLKHGLPEVRNNAGGHGKGNAPDAPEHLAAYAVHLAAVNIVLLVDAFHASEQKTA